MGKGHIPAFDEVLEVVTPLDPRLGFILQFRDLLPNDIGKEINKSCTGLHLCAVGREGEPMLCHFEKCDAGTPNIGCDRVRLAGDSFWCHVVGCSDEGVGISFRSELTANPEITELDLAVSAQKDITGFDVSVDNLLAVKIGEAVQDPLSNLP
jgi:hypothetical protein